ncbi:MAG: histidine kinase [Rubrivivax sp.]|nr:histidine kinase [Rubrivivax sp.]
MSDTAPAYCHPPLDQPLPADLTGTGHSWFTRYRRYPVFGVPWARLRTLSFGTLALLAVAVIVGPSALDEPLDRVPLGAFAQMAVQLLMPLLLGPWLGSRVRALGLPERREYAALVTAVVSTVLAVLAFHQFAAEPMKQRLAELTGAVDASGQRKRMAVAIGVIVRNPDDAASAAAGKARDKPSPEVRLTNAIASIAVSFWLAGGVALWGWRRERAGLAALARERELAQAQAQRREAELQLSVLAAQVEPHFLFNTLAGVRSAIATDPARASEMIDRLVDYLRAAIPRLRSSGGSEATLGGQLDIVRAYLGLMAARMPRLRYTLSAPPELLAAPFPPLMLISLAENAVKHGAEPKIGPVHIEVLAHRNATGGLEVTVADDGAGFGASAGGSGIGLSNIRERLRQMYGDAAALTLKTRALGGVAATLTLPPE